MSGVGSELAVSGRRGIELAIDHINQSGGVLGRSLELKVLDLNEKAQTPKLAFEAISKTANALVIGPFTSGNLIDALPVIEQSGDEILVLSPTVSADSLSGKDDNILRVMPSTAQQAKLLTQWLDANALNSNIVVYDRRNKGYTDLLVKNYVELHSAKTGEKPLVLPYDPSNPDEFNQVEAQILSVRPKSVTLICSAEDSAYLIQQASIKGLQTQWLGALWANTSELIKKGGDAVENMILVNAIDPNNESEAYLDFALAYKNRFGEGHSFSSVYSYESVFALKQAIEIAKSTEPSALKGAFVSLGAFNGLQTTIEIDAYGDCNRAFYLSRIVDGQLRKVE